MGSQGLPLKTNGIFHSLPTFSPDVKGLTAIITGANGISGFHTMRALLDSPERWTKIWAASRRPPPKEMMALLTEDQRSRVVHVACDFLSSPEDICKQLQEKNVSADYIFFYSYAQPKPKAGTAAWSNAQELVDTNSALLKNFLGALTHAKITPKRFLLQTGAKNYGGHIGPARTPYAESDPRVTLEPNFYYPQEDLLYQYCKDQQIHWNIICPAWIIGAVNNAAMNALHPLAVYAAVQAHKGEKLKYPGDYNAWLALGEHSTAYLTGYLSEWAVLEDKCKDQKFNSSDTCPIPNNRLWPELARWYGAKGYELPELDESKLTVLDAGDVPTPLGYGPSRKLRFAWTLTNWAQQEENQKAWQEISAKHNLTHNPFEDIQAHFEFGDFAAWGPAFALSMNKARYMGWTGHVDTLESLHMAYTELNKLGMLPPPVEKARPLI
ncbi:hypothetical protein LTR78_007913 [Recurvomyces mirabilis]|uniref:PRISE-like Rossmann-fold domain-containing protein n=1 Tax=Recurvomyces mirabilis TaxID=574656 RepID=A0AAE0TQX7_9PEZI|nr:hypothetical protein LTR78_007913 [Recurvomyces mirabilis]KAK5152448.1 hypothetical protein LTS14_008395 [Recurvomyces mirabilis]